MKTRIKFSIKAFSCLITFMMFGSFVMAQTYTTIPYSTGFETGVLDPFWTATSTYTTGEITPILSGSLVWNSISAISNTGNYFLGMHHLATGNGANNTNEANLNLNLSGISNVRLSFYWAHWDDETDAVDGMYISDDGGVTFTKVLDLFGGNYTGLVYNHFDFSLDSINLVHNLSFTSNYIVQFVQYDNYYFAGGNDGFLIDDLDVYQTCTSDNMNIVACDSFVSPSGNYTWFTSGIHHDTILPGVACADTAITVDLTIISSAATFDVVEACSFYLWPLTNDFYLASTMDTIVLTNQIGCDSLVILDLTIHEPEQFYDSITECNSYTWPVNGVTYTNSTNVNMVQGGSLSCDSSYTLVLDINYSDSLVNSTTSCNNYTWSVTGTTYTTSGLYVHNYVNFDGCLSSQTLDLTINQFDNSVTVTAPNELTANAVNAQYQWIDCDNDFVPITGEVNQVFTVPDPNPIGSYAVLVTQNSCTDTSECFSYFLNINDLESNNIIISPNPNNGTVNLKLNDIEGGSIKVYNLSGQLIFEDGLISGPNYQFIIDEIPGAYFIEVKSDKQIYHQKFIVE